MGRQRGLNRRSCSPPRDNGFATDMVQSPVTSRHAHLPSNQKGRPQPVRTATNPASESDSGGKPPFAPQASGEESALGLIPVIPAQTL